MSASRPLLATLVLLAIYLSDWPHPSYGADDSPDPTNTPAKAAPFFKPGDVVALVGGEDMVVAAELGYLEALIQRALPAHKLKFRSLAWEGDTVFEQPRMLNYPTLEAQLDDIGATVVICQFGQMESLAGKDKLPDFIAAYEKLLGRLSGGGKRRIIVVRPVAPKSAAGTSPEEAIERMRSFKAYFDAAKQVANATGAPCATPSEATIARLRAAETVAEIHRKKPVLIEGSPKISHPNQLISAKLFASNYAGTELRYLPDDAPASQARADAEVATFSALVAAKNRLWYHYYRPQNWAFLAGDRTNQPSSRDHKDPSKRWFPEEMKQWLPLIEEKEKEIWALAEKLAADAK